MLTLLKLTELQLKEVTNTDVDEKCHNSCYKSYDANQHPMHHLQVEIGLRAPCVCHKESDTPQFQQTTTYHLRISSEMFLVWNIVADVIIQTLYHEDTIMHSTSYYRTSSYSLHNLWTADYELKLMAYIPLNYLTCIAEVLLLSSSSMSENKNSISMMSNHTILNISPMQPCGSTCYTLHCYVKPSIKETANCCL